MKEGDKVKTKIEVPGRPFGAVPSGSIGRIIKASNIPDAWMIEIYDTILQMNMRYIYEECELELVE